VVVVLAQHDPRVGGQRSGPQEIAVHMVDGQRTRPGLDLHVAGLVKRHPDIQALEAALQHIVEIERDDGIPGSARGPGPPPVS
jgi:hypothetical protein